MVEPVPRAIFSWCRLRNVRKSVDFPFLPLLVLITGSSVIKGLFLFEIYLYGVLNVAFSVYEGARNDVCLIPFLPFVFFILHLSYGWGSLIGLIGLHRMNAESDSGKN